MSDEFDGFQVGGEDEEGDFVQLNMDPQVLDCADVLATILTRTYPDIRLELAFVLPAVWRPHWRITVPKDSDYKLAYIDTLAHETSMDIFEKHGTLVAYTISREKEEDEQAETMGD